MKVKDILKAYPKNRNVLYYIVPTSFNNMSDLEILKWYQDRGTKFQYDTLSVVQSKYGNYEVEKLLRHIEYSYPYLIIRKENPQHKEIRYKITKQPV